MTPEEVLKKLESMGNDSVRKHNKKAGADDKQFGVRHGDIRKLAAKLKTNHELALALWKTKNLDAQLLAVLVMDVKQLSAAELERLVRAVVHAYPADWLLSYVVKKHPEKEALRQKWMTAKNKWLARAGWSLTSERLSKNADGLDLSGLLDRIEAEMARAAPEVQWTMNFCLAGLGIHHAKLRPRAVAIGEALGIYRDYPVSKGCTSPFAPIWIKEMVRRQGG